MVMWAKILPVPAVLLSALFVFIQPKEKDPAPSNEKMQDWKAHLSGWDGPEADGDREQLGLLNRIAQTTFFSLACFAAIGNIGFLFLNLSGMTVADYYDYVAQFGWQVATLSFLFYIAWSRRTTASRPSKKMFLGFILCSAGFTLALFFVPIGH